MPATAVIAAREAQALGITRGQLRGPGFVARMRGVYTPAAHPAPNSPWTWAAIAVAASIEPAVVCGISALRLWGVALPVRIDRDRRGHLLYPRGATVPIRPQLAVHRTVDIGRVAVRDCNGLTVCDPVEAWMQVARIVNLDELVQIGDGLIRYRDPLTDLGAIRDYVDARRPNLPTVKALKALVDMRAGTESIRETWLRQVARADGFPEPAVNRELIDREGRFLARPDLYWEKVLVAGEYDGDCHEGERQRVKDNARRRLLESHGIAMVVATKGDIHDPSAFLATLHAAFDRQARRLGVDSVHRR